MDIIKNVSITYAICSVLYFSISGMFTYVDIKKRPKNISKRKIQEKRNDNNMIKDGYRLAFKRLILDSPINIAFISSLFWLRGIEFSPLGSWKNITLNFIGHYIITDIVFYINHRISHIPFFYKHIHKTHHKFTAPIAVSAVYCERSEMLLVNLLSLIAPALILKCSLFINMFWICFAIINTTIVHSGYDLRPYINPLSHDRHHKYFNMHYGSGGIIDYLFKTRYEDITKK